MLRFQPCLVGAAGFLVCVATAVGSASIEQVEIQAPNGEAGRFRVVSSEVGPLGSDGVIRGAGGSGYVQNAANAGADALRTWGLRDLPQAIADAEENGLRISAGIWMPHSPKFYENCTDLDADSFWQDELHRYVEGVRQYKNSSAILWWTVGNEEEIEVDVFKGNDCVWKRLEWAVQAVKAEDPNHPVGTVLAGVMSPKVHEIAKWAPSLDFLGVNSYGDDSLHVGSLLHSWNWTKPYAIMEYGPTGHWSSPTTEWGAYIEETSSEKAPRYNATCYSCLDDPYCVGTFAFVWGWKWEKTGTWYNLFNEWGAVTEGVAVNCTRCESEVLAVLEKCWTGKNRAVRPPSIVSVEVDGEVLRDFSFTVDRRKAVQLRVNATHPLGKDLVAIWAATEEVVSNAIGGAWEATNPLLPSLWPASDESTSNTTAGLAVQMDTSQLNIGGEYRLYVFVRQDPASCAEGACRNQEASASLPFYICHTAQPGDECYSHVTYAMESGIYTHPQTYPGVNASSSFEEFQVMLHQKGEGSCPAPCDMRAWCHTSVEGEECYGFVHWAMEHDIQKSPELYPASLWNSTSFEAFQQYLHERRDGICPQPCAPRGMETEPSSSKEPESISLGAVPRLAKVPGFVAGLLGVATVAL